MTFAEIDAELRDILESIIVDEETGEILMDLDFDRIEALKMEKQNKMESLGMFFKELEYEIEAIKAEEKKLKERAATKQRKLDRLNDYLTSKLTLDPDYTNGFETPKVIMKLRKSSSVEIVNEDLIPKSYMRKTIKIEPDKVKIKSAIKAKKKVPGARVVENQNLKVT